MTSLHDFKQIDIMTFDLRGQKVKMGVNRYQLTFFKFG